MTDGAPRRVFLLSPASCAGQRARLLFNPGASFELARAVRTSAGVPLGQVFSFLSGLYFRGKLEYASTWASPPDGTPGVFVVTAGDGLCLPQTRIGIDMLERWAATPIDVREPRYTGPLLRDARTLASSIGGGACEVVLLGSVATGKYVDLLQEVFGTRLLFPVEFVGRGDMSRGGLLLRSARDRRELLYQAVAGAVRHGARPPRLVPRPGIVGAALRRTR
ncbi:MAG TPA: hypothetical protein VLA79_07490 [Polyangia bacterium]|nr:hypothetical protein [Polyangia bacterium]